MSAAVAALGGLVEAIGPVTPDAPEAVKAGVNKALQVIMYVSLACCMAVLLSAGLLIAAESRGYGGGMSQELKSKLVSVVTALVVISAASGIVNFFR